MENFSHSSYSNSRDSSPRSREIENENPSFDEPPPSNTTTTTTKVKFMCSYGGKIQPRAHDNQLAYIGGDTKILAVDRNIKFSTLMSKLSSLTNSNVCFKYQLPGEDLDALISVTNEEDLEHMMVEYDRLCRTSPRPARLRLILFTLTTYSSAPTANEVKQERQWFVDALNSVQVPLLEGSTPPPPQQQPANPDFLFGLDKAYPESAAAPTVPEIAAKDSAAGSECGSEEQQAVGEPLVQIGSNEQLLQRKIDEENGGVYNNVDYYYSQKNQEQEKVAHARASPHMHVYSGSVAVPVPVPVYFIQTPSGMYQAVRPVVGPVGQTYYAVQRMVPAAADVYNAVPPASLSHSNSAPKIGYNGSEVGVVTEHGYSQVACLPERSGVRRQAAAAPGGGEGRN